MYSSSINLDDLYEAKRARDLKQLDIFMNILSKIHTKIKNISKQANNESCCWYLIPERIVGSIVYEQGACIEFVMDKLIQNKFKVNYFVPNTLLVSWGHWVPNYIRTEFNKKTGNKMNEYGDIIVSQNSDKHQKVETAVKINKQKFVSTNEYKPNGIYDFAMIHRNNKK